MKPAIIGLAGPHLTTPEATLLRTHQPAGVILFARNIHSPPQLASLIAAIRDELRHDPILMVDQEGGRVARLRPPHWRAHASAAVLARSGLRAAFLSGALIGLEAAAAGFNVVAAPVLDLAVPGASGVIGDRAFGSDPHAVARLGRAQADGLLSAGILPVMKHLPGHGAALADSHHTLPVIHSPDAEAALPPFILNAGLPWAMTAHILYPEWDPHRPATLSSTIIQRIIRGRIGFEGVLVSDDLAMQALTGEPAERASAALQAGCDLALYCAGDLAATAALLEACTPISPASVQRLAIAAEWAGSRRIGLDPAALGAEQDRILA